MATYASLTPDQKSTLLAFMPAFRGAIVGYVQALNTLQDLDTAWNSNVKAINGLLDSSTTIPDATGLAGAQSLTNNDTLLLMDAIEAFLATNNNAAWRTYFVRIGGIGNTMQSG